MFILDLVVIGLIVLGAFSGHKRGLVGIVVSFISLILALVLAFVLQSTVANALYDSGLGKSVSGIVEDNINQMIKEKKNVEDSFYGTIISNVTTPEQVSQASQTVTMFIMKGISFIAIFLVVKLICYILQMVLNLVFNLPILSSINGIGGTIIGALSVILKIWILLAILSFIAPLPMFASIEEYIDQTFVIKLLYNYNFIVSIIKSGLNI